MEKYDDITIYHICCSLGEQSSGMAVVIPEHVKEQSRYVKTCLINLHNYRFQDLGFGSNSYNLSDLNEMGIDRIYEINGKPDLYVIHGVYLPTIWNFWRKHIRSTIPYIIIPHGSFTKSSQSVKSWKKRIANAIVISKITKECRAIQFLSKDEKNNSIYRNIKSIVCPNGIHIVDQAPQFLSKELKLVYIGRIDIYHKGLDLLLMAASKCKNICRENNVKICIYGPNRTQDYIKLIKLINDYQISDIILINNEIFGEDKKIALLEASYFIQTSRSEGLPMGILEAMSYGLPLLITEGTRMSDLVKSYKNGDAQPTTVEGVCKLIQFAIDNKQNMHTFSNNSKKCAKHYSWDVVGKHEVKIYQRIIEMSK